MLDTKLKNTAVADNPPTPSQIRIEENKRN